MYGLEISVSKAKSVAFKGCFPVRCKVDSEKSTSWQVESFNFLGCDLPYIGGICQKRCFLENL